MDRILTYQNSSGEILIHTPLTKHKNTSPQEAVLPLVLFILSPIGNPPPPHWSRVLHRNGGPNQCKSCVFVFFGFGELVREFMKHVRA